MRKSAQMLVTTLLSMTLLLSMAVPSLAADKIVLKVADWWNPQSNPTTKVYFDEMKAEFERLNPDIEIEYIVWPWSQYIDSLVTNVAAGTGPDVGQISVSWARDLYDKGVIRELNSFVEKSKSAALDQFIPAAHSDNNVNGVYYGIPYMVDATALAYNIDHFESAGLDSRPYGLETWDDFVNAAKLLTQRSGNDITRSGYLWGLNSSQTFNSWLHSNGGTFYNKDMTGLALDTINARETLDFLRDLYITHEVLGGPDARDFVGGSVSMRNAGTWSGNNWTHQNPDLNMMLTSNPVGPSGSKRGAVTWSNMFSMFSSTKHPEAAWRYIEFVTGRENQLRLLQIKDQTSARKDVMTSDAWMQKVEAKPYLQVVVDILEVGGVNLGYLSSQIDPVVRPLIGEAVEGKISTVEALENAQRLGNAVFPK